MTDGRKRPRGFYGRHVWPRRKSILIHRNVAFSLLAGSAITLINSFFGANLGFGEIKFSSISESLMAFAALSFGGCITGATVAIALPNDRLLATMALNSPIEDVGGRGKVRVRLDENGKLIARHEGGTIPNPVDFSSNYRSHYRELIFTFAYSAVVQLGLVMVSVAALLVRGNDYLYSAGECSFVTRLVIFILGAFFTYSILQLIAVVEALVGVGNLRDEYVRRDYLA